jgi:hypothetical protein
MVGGVSHADPDDLPDIGSPAQAMLTLEDEYQIGRMIVRGLRDQDQILEDPEVTEYIRSLGYKLSSQAHDGSQRFNFFMVRDNTINAFALPGGFIGVNTGLLLKTDDESELAGVLAHEIAHVTQRHIARSIAPAWCPPPRCWRRSWLARRPAVAMPRWLASQRRRAWQSSSRSASRAPTKPKPTASAWVSWPAPASIRMACRDFSRP